MKLERIDIAPSPDRPRWTRLTGQVRYDRPQDGKDAEAYWYEFPDEFAGSLTTGGDPWLACLLPVAVEIGEPLVLSRPVDALMLDHARDRMAIWHWWNRRHAPVRIEADVEAAPHERGTRTVSLFSGGVDSFYAALAPRSLPIDDLLVIHGAFDLMHARRDAFERVQAKLQAAADALGKVLIPSATNLLHTRLGTTDLAYMSQGSMMGSVPLALERRYARILIPSSVDLDWKEAWGTHPITDAMLSTSATFVAEDGYAVVVRADCPEAPGAAIEAPMRLRSSGEDGGPVFYRMSQGFSRFEDPISYVVVLDSCNFIFEPSVKVFTDFLNALVIE